MWPPYLWQALHLLVAQRSIPREQRTSGMGRAYNSSEDNVFQVLIAPQHAVQVHLESAVASGRRLKLERQAAASCPEARLEAYPPLWPPQLHPRRPLLQTPWQAPPQPVDRPSIPLEPRMWATERAYNSSEDNVSQVLIARQHVALDRAGSALVLEHKRKLGRRAADSFLEMLRILLLLRLLSPRPLLLPAQLQVLRPLQVPHMVGRLSTLQVRRMWGMGRAFSSSVAK